MSKVGYHLLTCVALPQVKIGHICEMVLYPSIITTQGLSRHHERLYHSIQLIGPYIPFLLHKQFWPIWMKFWNYRLPRLHSDRAGTHKKCHCKRNTSYCVTVSKKILLERSSGNLIKCHCKQSSPHCVICNRCHCKRGGGLHLYQKKTPSAPLYH